MKLRITSLFSVISTCSLQIAVIRRFSHYQSINSKIQPSVSETRTHTPYFRNFNVKLLNIKNISGKMVNDK